MRITLSILALLCVHLGGCARSAPNQPSANDVQEFHAAVADGDGAIIERLLKAKPQLVNAKNAAGETPLAVAKRQAESDAADVIRRHGGKE